jgi:phospholipid/cholesterol/gamma-HCH transport system permease protein
VSLAPVLEAGSFSGAWRLAPGGAWTALHAARLEALRDGALPSADAAPRLEIDLSGVTELDTIGAWVLEKLARRAAAAGHAVSVTGIAARHAGLIEEVRQVNRKPAAPAPPRRPVTDALAAVGHYAASAAEDFSLFLRMLGALAFAVAAVLRRPRALRVTSLVYHLHRVGWQAIPIVALITFLIGAIIAQQGIFHFRKFGAESYVVDMVGILVLREIGVLIVAIMVAGRSGSAYTAELGSMKMREEIDALSTMGLDPVEVLILPRIIALLVALPILTFLGAMAALYGGGLVAWFYGGMSPPIFLARLHEAISVTHFEVGMIKAPFMALVIGIVASGEGLRVKGSAESLGRQTTTSVVKSIFLVIVLDGLFAVFFAAIGM